MNKKQELIKIKVQDIYQKIKRLNEELSEIRKNCKHEVVEKCTYSWAPGGHDIHNAKVCSICGELITKPYEIDFIREYKT